MKTFDLKDGVWVELISVTPTQEQLDILASEDESLNEQKKTILSQINYSEPAMDASKLEELYQSMIPTEPGVYELLGVQLSEDNGEYFGILNCRINGEHKQIRL
jgi:hypothetical protein